MNHTHGLLGYPLGHTLSPPIHAALFQLQGVCADYRIYEIPPQELAKQISTLTTLDWFNVTIPYKTEIIPYLDRLDQTAARYHSVNLVACAAEKVGYNTDVIGFLKSIKQLGAPLNGRVLLLGCGGVGRTVAIETALQGGDLTVAVLERDLPLAEKAVAEMQALKPDTTVKIVTIDQIDGEYDLLINATPVGMYPHINQSPVSEDTVRRAKYLFDVIYNPVETKLMQMAKANGLQTLGGMAMLVHQAVAAHEILDGATFDDAQIAEIITQMERRISHDNP